MLPGSILVTGGTGLLGRGLIETAPAELPRILSIHQREYAVKDSRADHRTVDIRQKKAVDELFEEHRFDAVIHAGGIASVDFVERNYAESLESNLVGTLNITSACRRSGVYLIYISTNAVYDGTSPPYRETDPIHPINKYGVIKAQCERLIQETLTRYLIFRPILMYGWHHPQCRPNPASWLHGKLSKGKEVRMVNDVFENPLFSLQCGQALWSALALQPSGIVHVGGADRVSRYEFALTLAKTFGFDPGLVRAVDSSFFPAIAPRPANTTFDVGRMERELGVRAWTLEEGLRAMRDRPPGADEPGS